MDLIRLLARIGADTSDFDSGMDHVRSTALGLAGGIAVGLAAAVAGGVAASVKVASDFDQSLRSLASSTGATVDQVAAIRQEALGIGKDTSLSATQAVSAMTELAKAGMDTELIVGGAARSVVQLAEATGSDVTSMAILTSNALNTFKGDALNAETATNLLAKAANASAIGTADLTTTLAAVGPVAALAGLNMRDFVTVSGLMGNNALKGSDAGTSLKTMLTSLAAPTKDARALMAQLGLSLYDAAGQTKPFRDVIGELQRGLKGATEEQQAFTLKTLFGQDAIRVGSILLKEGVEGWDAFGAAMDAAPSIAEQSAVRLAGLNGTMQQLGGSVETLGIGLGSKFLPGLQALATMGLGSLNTLISADWSRASASFDRMGESLGKFGGPISIVVDSAKRAFGLDSPDALPNLVKGAIDGFTGVLDGALPTVQNFARIIDLAISGDTRGAFDRLVGIVEDATPGFVAGVAALGEAGRQALITGITQWAPDAILAMMVVNAGLEEWGRTSLYDSLKAAATDGISRAFKDAVHLSIGVGGSGDFWKTITETISDPARVTAFTGSLQDLLLGPIGAVFHGLADRAAKDFVAWFIATFAEEIKKWDFWSLVNPLGAGFGVAKSAADKAAQAIIDEHGRQSPAPIAANPVNPSAIDYPYGGERAEGGPMDPFTSYLVGERGKAEILTMGSMPGFMTPIEDFGNRVTQAFNFENHFHGSDFSSSGGGSDVLQQFIEAMVPLVMRRFSAAMRAS